MVNSFLRFLRFQPLSFRPDNSYLGCQCPRLHFSVILFDILATLDIFSILFSWNICSFYSVTQHPPSFPPSLAYSFPISAGSDSFLQSPRKRLSPRHTSHSILFSVPCTGDINQAHGVNYLLKDVDSHFWSSSILWGPCGYSDCQLLCLQNPSNECIQV